MDLFSVSRQACEMETYKAPTGDGTGIVLPCAFRIAIETYKAPGGDGNLRTMTN